MMLIAGCVLSTVSCGPQKPSTFIHTPSGTAASPCKKEIEDLLEKECAECRNVHFMRLGGVFNTTLAYLEVPQSSVPTLLDQSSRLPSYGELKSKPQSMTFMMQFEACADWWRPSELENATFARRVHVVQHEDDPNFELLSTMTVATGVADSGWVRIYICYQGEIVPRSR